MHGKCTHLLLVHSRFYFLHLNCIFGLHVKNLILLFLYVFETVIIANIWDSNWLRPIIVTIHLAIDNLCFYEHRVEIHMNQKMLHKQLTKPQTEQNEN